MTFGTAQEVVKKLVYEVPMIRDHQDTNNVVRSFSVVMASVMEKYSNTLLVRWLTFRIG